MRLATLVRYLYLSRFSKPVGDRVLYRAMRRTPVCRILEIGIGSTPRSLRLIDLAQRLHGQEPVRYTAIDLFEARPADRTRLSLKDAHRLFKATGAQAQLIPGDAAGAIARSANSLPNQDLVLIAADHDPQALSGAWFYLPRMLHPKSCVFVETHDATSGIMTYRPLELGEIQARAMAARKRRAA